MTEDDLSELADDVISKLTGPEGFVFWETARTAFRQGYELASKPHPFPPRPPTETGFYTCYVRGYPGFMVLFWNGKFFENPTGPVDVPTVTHYLQIKLLTADDVKTDG